MRIPYVSGNPVNSSWHPARGLQRPTPGNALRVDVVLLTFRTVQILGSET
ncbi:hypothetical protein [Streptomyces griseochromogenes]